MTEVRDWLAAGGMVLDDIDDLDLWRGSEIVEKMVRLQAVALGGGAALGEPTMAATEQAPVMTGEEKRTANEWGADSVRVEHGPWHETPTTRTRKSRTVIGWRGAAKPKE